jgi:hypothetical protein
MPSSPHDHPALKQCAWCRRVFAGDDAAGSPLPALVRGISHGICSRCWDAELASEARRLMTAGDRVRALHIERERLSGWQIGARDQRAEGFAEPRNTPGHRETTNLDAAADLTSNG